MIQNDHQKAVALVAALLDMAADRAASMEGKIQLLTGSERETLFHLVAPSYGEGVAYTIEGIAKATAKFLIVPPE